MLTKTKVEDRLTRQQVAELLGVHPSSLARYTAHGLRGIRLPRHRCGGKVYFLKSDIDAWQKALEDHHGDATGVHVEQSLEDRIKSANAACEALGV